jgi:hypothetical protein
MLNCKFSSEVPLDIGASACIMDKDFAMKHCLELIGKAHPILVEVIDGWFLASGNVIEETQPLKVMLRDQVSYVVFNIIQCPTNPIILGLPWFEIHILDVDWNLRRISSKSKSKIKENI